MCLISRDEQPSSGDAVYGPAWHYKRGHRIQSWTDALAVGTLPTGARADREIDELVATTMRRVRRNVEVLVGGLIDLGWVFEVDTPLVDPSPDIGSELDRAEATVGTLPLVLRCFAEVVGQVNLNGTLPGWDCSTPDPIVVETPVDYWLSDYELWQGDQGTEWERPGPFVVEVAPDRLHKADISGGAPYAMAVPNGAVDGLLIGEHHQTTLVNYLRICFGMAGMGGLDHEDELAELPPELHELAASLERI